MNQSSVIAFALLVGFLVFIINRGELPDYLNVVGLGSNDTEGVTPMKAAYN